MGRPATATNGAAKPVPPPAIEALKTKPIGKTMVSIKAPDIRTLILDVEGTAPLVVHRFSAKALAEMEATQSNGPQGGTRKRREAKNFESVFQSARHVSDDGWDGISAGGLRAAMISACRLVSFKMTIAKMSVFILADGYDRIDGTPLVRIHGPPPERNLMHARNATGVIDIRHRPMWKKWRLQPRIRYDADQFDASDVVNLLMRVGEQVGLGEGRHDSKNSTGLGWGTFRVLEEKELAA